MREILFRGKTLDGRWVEGSYGHSTIIGEDTYVAAVIYSNDTNLFSADWDEVIPETVGQYIDAEDKNGNKVFEGDILRYTPRPECTIYYKVIWNQEWSRFALVQWSTHKYQLYEWAEFSKVKYCCEVIGNIYDNPDLLESLENN